MQIRYYDTGSSKWLCGPECPNATDYQFKNTDDDFECTATCPPANSLKSDITIQLLSIYNQGTTPQSCVSTCNFLPQANIGGDNFCLAKCPIDQTYKYRTVRSGSAVCEDSCNTSSPPGHKNFYYSTGADSNSTSDDEFICVTQCPPLGGSEVAKFKFYSELEGQECKETCSKYVLELQNSSLVCVDACPSTADPAKSVEAKPLVNKQSSGLLSGLSVCVDECPAEKPYIFMNSLGHKECASSCHPAASDSDNLTSIA